MTSDAKIGLLLGLVFIFVIAFIINGLPNLRPQQATHADVPVVVGFPDEEMSVAGKTQAEAGRGWDALVANDQEPAEQTGQTPTPQPAAVVETPAPQTQVAADREVRFEGPLPAAETSQPKVENPLARIENLLERLTNQQSEEAVSTVNMNVSSQPEPAVAAERQPPIQTFQPRAEAPAAQTPSQTGEQPKPAATPAAKPAVATAKPAGKVYVVGDGESLSTVAKNVYGAEEGNRYVNINRIYEANKDVLKSVDQVVAGQKLIIPPLPKATTNPNKPSDVLSRELFEKVETIAKRSVSQAQTPALTQTQVQKQTPAPTATAEGRWYTVQDGDNLWKIASAQLGAGARYEEIAKLNAGLLKDGEKLSVGMKIRLPQK